MSVLCVTFQVDVELTVNSTEAEGSRIIFLVLVSQDPSIGYAKIGLGNLQIPQIFVSISSRTILVGAVNADSMSTTRQAILLINDRPVNFKIDTGSQANIIKPLKAELDRIMKAGAVEKVNEPTDRVSPVVIVEKKNGA
ncbi:hypothetical protein AVEN_201365-1 [Araneus ventricosus]|uniref:Uncharacterized protein n=1 Tax=Araneus ventricosus TaxID=182803 RepID=A0A4Y2UMT3_ARAVE|nr:hypothetical protein AVEN_201365-1 [Araneus ventricosus]